MSNAVLGVMEVVAYDAAGVELARHSLPLTTWYEELHALIDEDAARRHLGLRRLEGKKLDQHGRLLERWENRYDEQGRIIETRALLPDGRVREAERMEYGPDGRVRITPLPVQATEVMA